MTTPLLDPARGRDPQRALHDRLEDAYLALARTSGRFYERRTSRGVFHGFAGLDAATMNRVALLRCPDAGGVIEVLDEAEAFFAERRVPWSVQLTPYAEPGEVARVLRGEGFTLASELSVMTLGRLVEPPLPAARHVTVRPCGPGELSAFTALIMDAFRMPARFFPALVDINQAWVAGGAHAYLAERNGTPVGTALLASCDGVSGIYNVCTTRAHRRSGVATALMAAAIEDHRATGDDVLTLQVASGSIAERLYERLGFARRYGWTLYARG